MTRIYLIRHAQAEGNLYCRMNGWYNSILTETGKRQVAALAGRLAPLHLDAVYSSPLARCTTTARAAYIPKRMPLQIELGLMEMGVGDWENVPYGELQVKEPELLGLFESGSPAFRVHGGESFAGMQQRMAGTLCRLAERNPDKTIACFSHGLVIRAALAWFLGYGAEGIPRVSHSGNTGVSCLELEGREAAVRFMADCSHLPTELATGIYGKKPLSVGEGNLWFRPWRPYLEKELYLSCRREAWVDIHGSELPFDGESFYQVALRSSEEDPRAVMVAYLGREMVGMIQTDLTRDAGEGVCFVPFVYMNPAYRHKGLGVQLLGQAVATARPLGRDRLRLRCAPTNGIAQRFYRRYGFRKVGEEPDSRVPLDLLEKYIGYEWTGDML